MNKILPVYKPIGLSSYDMIRIFKKERNFQGKIGHGGTLDPFACGVLLLLLGEATKKFEEIKKWQKVYLAGLRLGATSSTGDPEGEIKTMMIEKKPSLKEIKKTISLFEGEILQKVPQKSAAKYKGKPLYQIKEKIEKKKKVFIEKIEVINYKFPLLTLRVFSGGGVYIRQLAEDIGEKLKCGAFLYFLEREKVGPYSKKDCLKFFEIGRKG